MSNYKLSDHPLKGRIAIATRDIKPFELIIREEAVAHGPFSNSHRVCLVCLRGADDDDSCPKCSSPMHSECRRGAGIHQYECDTLRQLAGIPLVGLYSFILPLRLFRLKTLAPDQYARVTALESHIDKRTIFNESYRDALRKCHLSDDEINELEVLAGVLLTNSACFGSERGMAKGHGLFPRFSMLSHDCAANCRYFASEENGKVTVEVRAKVKIAEGTEITIQYKNPLLGNVARTTALKSHWKFDCSCQRCQDPTEMGTYLSAVRCFLCDDGVLLPASSESPSVSWTCRTTGCTGFKAAEEIMDDIKDFDARIKSTSCLADPKEWEDLLAEAVGKYHENHYLGMDIKRVLIQVYGSLPGYTLNKLSIEQIERKLELCRNYIAVYGPIDPGFTKWKGRILEEMIGPLLILSKTKSENNEIDHAELLSAQSTAFRLMNEAFKCRQFERGDLGKNTFASLVKEFNHYLS